MPATINFINNDIDSLLLSDWWLVVG